MISVDTLRKIRKETKADKVRLEVGEFPDNFEVEVHVFKDEKIFGFSTDYSGDDAYAPSFANYVIKHIQKRELEESETS